jgi:hypothetical protein
VIRMCFVSLVTAMCFVPKCNDRRTLLCSLSWGFTFLSLCCSLQQQSDIQWNVRVQPKSGCKIIFPQFSIQTRKATEVDTFRQ